MKVFQGFSRISYFLRFNEEFVSLLDKVNNRRMSKNFISWLTLTYTLTLLNKNKQYVYLDYLEFAYKLRQQVRQRKL